MDLDTIPLFEHLENSQNILIAGAGGGFDVFAGLPLFLHLLDKTKHVVLANLSFTSLSGVTGERLGESAVRVTADSRGPPFYFPEGYLCEWLALAGLPAHVYCLEPNGVQPLLRGYRAIIEREQIDVIILVDGGTDSLMRGDEVRLGTPEEDLMSMVAVGQTSVTQCYLVCLGFGIDYFHGVSHGLFLENVAALAKRGAYHGVFPLLREMPVARRYREACDYVFSRMPHHPSIVNSSILSAVAGEFGDFHATERTTGSQLWINPLMSLYWVFELAAVLEQCLYAERLIQTETRFDVRQAIFEFRSSLTDVRGCDTIPL